MKTTKRLGIWMDHSIANLIKISKDAIVIKTIEATPLLTGKFKNLKKDENLKQNKEKNQLSIFYKKISEIIKEYKEVVLFGPTDAKNELMNLLKSDHLFENIKIEAINADKMTENQQQAFVKNYFNLFEKNH
ncbi:MAG: hypothetical protein A2275_17230 [Bacteroidetes bacterium RIFOXYA12_FULL_35_11]|nr:MAG: hypothetical protein A2X01_00715 [Bacteroidetes bacterium GWF2_35_48]OFY73803.1 MAG: hypothetical protein A2275_17230 [Bacteroidetes bacterium RIFOXYA12_FULL_35_11]OFY96309.1 MAG: hypothetical protein A2491_04940 [Bacteroidetes bacterium RIFOXYC12_FULL_35_7]HBX50079.1 hypothetical protein [Bacteroidales bacterium]